MFSQPVNVLDDKPARFARTDLLFFFGANEQMFETNYRMLVFTLQATIGCFAFASTSIAQVDASSKGTSAEVRSADVHARMAEVHAELEVIRAFMGKPRTSTSHLVIENAAPREVYFQALALLKNTSQFCFDHTREKVEIPTVPRYSIVNADVLNLVDQTLELLRRVKQNYGISNASHGPGTVDDATPTDVFQSVVQANRQLNLLLDRQVAPSDVFEQVTIGIGYAQRLLEQTPAGSTMPATPRFEPNRNPSDVYARLLTCLKYVHTIADRSDLQVLEIEAPHDLDQVLPSDVLHLASLVNSELAYLHTQFPDAEPPREVFYVGRKFPSDVFQRVGILEQQLSALAKYAEAHPEWLREVGTDR